MNANDMYPSKYLKASDIGDSKVTATIKSVKVESMGGEEEAESKPVVFFEGKEKGLVCNKTNWNTIIDLYGYETDDWIGKKITMKACEVSFKGKMTMAIRVSTIRPGEAIAVKTVLTKSEVENDDIPF